MVPKGNVPQVLQLLKRQAGFLQTSSRIRLISEEQQLRTLVVKLLRKSPMELDAFTKVNKAIGGMVAELKAQQKDCFLRIKMNRTHGRLPS